MLFILVSWCEAPHSGLPGPSISAEQCLCNLYLFLCLYILSPPGRLPGDLTNHFFADLLAAGRMDTGSGNAGDTEDTADDPNDPTYIDEVAGAPQKGKGPGKGKGLVVPDSSR